MVAKTGKEELRQRDHTIELEPKSLKVERFLLLANTKNLSDLEHWQKEKLVSDWRKGHAKLEELGKEKSARLKRALKNKSFRESWKGSDAPYEWLLFWNVHPYAYEFINSLADGRKVDLPKDFKERVFRLNPTKIYPATEQSSPAVAYDLVQMFLDSIFDELWKIITTRPFHRCATCKKVFIKILQKQKYCEKKCANKAIGPRTEYMREYMQGRRKVLNGENSRAEKREL